MKKKDLISYLKIFGGIMLSFPLLAAFFALDYGAKEGLMIASVMYLCLMLIGIPMFNYLQYGSFSYLNRWTKWSVYMENQLFVQVTYSSPILGSYPIAKENVMVDIYCKENKVTGLKKYKRVVKKCYKIK